MMQSVQVIIERLKSHPEDFFGDISDVNKLGMPRSKFYEITDKINDLLTPPQDGHIHRLWYLNEDEKTALLDAYKEARRSRFEAKVFHTLLTAQEPQETNTVTYKATNRYDPHTGKAFMQGSTTMIAPQNMITESLALLNSEFDKQYAKNRNT